MLAQIIFQYNEIYLSLNNYELFDLAFGIHSLTYECLSIVTSHLILPANFHDKANFNLQYRFPPPTTPYRITINTNINNDAGLDAGGA